MNMYKQYLLKVISHVNSLTNHNHANLGFILKTMIVHTVSQFEGG